MCFFTNSDSEFPAIKIKFLNLKFEKKLSFDWPSWKTISTVTIFLKLISRYRIASNPPSDQSDPKSWTIQVSTDNSNWTTVDTQTNQSIASNTGYLLTNTYYEIPLNNQYDTHTHIYIYAEKKIYFMKTPKLKFHF